MKQVATLWGVWALWVWMCIALSGCVTGGTRQFDPTTGKLIFESTATGTGSHVAKAQKSVVLGSPDKPGYLSLKAGIQGLDSASAMMLGMKVVQETLTEFMKMQQSIKEAEIANPTPTETGPLDFLSTDERTRLLDFLTTRAGSP